MKLVTYFKSTCVALCILFLLGCNESSYQVEMLDYDPATDSMVYKVNTVETLSDIHRLEGRATDILGGLSIELDSYNLEVRWNRVGTSVAFSGVKTGDVYYPEDFNSLAMISIYYNIERAMLYFESIGMDKDMLGSLETYYWAEVYEFESEYTSDVEPSVDNAFYMAVDRNDRGFYILPFNIVKEIPFSMNPGIMTHEYSHAVFQALIYDKLASEPSQIAYNYMYGLNEGIADVFAVALTGDPDFIRHSLSDPEVTRDASLPIVYTASYENSIDGIPGINFDPYQIGSFVSATLYEVGRRIQGLGADGPAISNAEARKNIAQATFRSLYNLGEDGAEEFVLTDFFNAFIPQFAPVNQAIVCDVLSERYAIHFAEIEGCL